MAKAKLLIECSALCDMYYETHRDLVEMAHRVVGMMFHYHMLTTSDTVDSEAKGKLTTLLHSITDVNKQVLSMMGSRVLYDTKGDCWYKNDDGKLCAIPHVHTTTVAVAEPMPYPSHTGSTLRDSHTASQSAPTRVSALSTLSTSTSSTSSTSTYGMSASFAQSSTRASPALPSDTLSTSFVFPSAVSSVVAPPSASAGVSVPLEDEHTRRCNYLWRSFDKVTAKYKELDDMHYPDHDGSTTYFIVCQCDILMAELALVRGLQYALYRNGSGFTQIAAQEMAILKLRTSYLKDLGNQKHFFSHDKDGLQWYTKDTNSFSVTPAVIADVVANSKIAAKLFQEGGLKRGPLSVPYEVTHEDEKKKEKQDEQKMEKNGERKAEKIVQIKATDKAKGIHDDGKSDSLRKQISKVSPSSALVLTKTNTKNNKRPGPSADDSHPSDVESEPSGDESKVGFDEWSIIKRVTHRLGGKSKGERQVHYMLEGVRSCKSLHTLNEVLTFKPVEESLRRVLDFELHKGPVVTRGKGKDMLEAHNRRICDLMNKFPPDDNKGVVAKKRRTESCGPVAVPVTVPVTVPVAKKKQMTTVYFDVPSDIMEPLEPYSNI